MKPNQQESMTTSEQIDWREDFEDQFAVEWHEWGADFAWADNADAKGSQIMQFIQDLLSQERQRVIELVESKYLVDKPVDGIPPLRAQGYNQALDDIISSLKERE